MKERLNVEAIKSVILDGLPNFPNGQIESLVKNMVRVRLSELYGDYPAEIDNVTDAAIQALVAEGQIQWFIDPPSPRCLIMSDFVDN